MVCYTRADRPSFKKLSHLNVCTYGDVERLHVWRRSALTVRSPRVDRPLFNMFGHPNILKVGRSIRGILATEKGEERNKKNKNRFVVCQVSRHTTNDQNLSCALDLAHDKMKFKFCKRSWMVK